MWGPQRCPLIPCCGGDPVRPRVPALQGLPLLFHLVPVPFPESALHRGLEELESALTGDLEERQYLRPSSLRW